MIFDSLSHIDNYRGLGNVYTALEMLKNTDFSTMEVGRYEVNEDIYYMVQEYDSKPKTVSEVHETFIDIQLLLSGAEVIGIAPLETEKTLVEAKPEKDIWKYTCETQFVALAPGDFMVLYPTDIHMPGATLGESVPCRKVVVKVRA